MTDEELIEVEREIVRLPEVQIARIVTDDPAVEVLCGASAVAGAIWSVFAGFRSGRGVGTAVGTMLVIQPVAVLLAAPVFVGVILLTRYVSLGSLLGSAAMFPAMLLVLEMVWARSTLVIFALKPPVFLLPEPKNATHSVEKSMSFGAWVPITRFHAVLLVMMNVPPRCRRSVEMLANSTSVTETVAASALERPSASPSKGSSPSTVTSEEQAAVARRVEARM